MRPSQRHTPAFVLAVILAGSASTHAAEFLLNGGFESGSFDAWGNSFADVSGYFTIEDSTSTDLSANSTVGPYAGSYYSVTDNTGPAAAILWQTFTLPESSSVSLSFRMFADSHAPIVVGAGNLDRNSGSNQHARVDLLSWNDFQSAPYSTATAINLWSGGTHLGPTDDPSPFALHSYDLTSTLGAGGIYVLRFGFVATEDVFNLGLDEAHLLAEPAGAAVPEPGTTWAGVIALAGLESSRRLVLGRRSRARR